MKHTIALGLWLFALPLAAQSWCADANPCKNYIAAGISVDKNTRLATFTGLYERDVNRFGTGWVTFGDFVPTLGSGTDTGQFLITSLSTGVEQRVFQTKRIGLYIPAAAGFSASPNALGWAFTTGAMLKLSYVDLNARLLKSSINNYAGYDMIFGVTFGLRF